MRAVMALPGVARRWSGLTTLLALAATVTLVRLTTLSPTRLAMSGAYTAPNSFFVLHPGLGWEYYGFLMNGHGAPPPRWPRFGNGGVSAAAGLAAAKEDRGQEDTVLAGTELASGRKPKDDAEAAGRKGNSDTLDGGLVQSSVTADTGRASAPAAQPSLVQLGLPAKYPATYFHDTTPARPVMRPGVIPESVAMPVLRTWVSTPQQFLAQILPGAKFFRVNVGSPLTMEYWLSFADGQSFRLDEMSGILASQGISFDSSSVYAAAKLAVLFAYCGRGPASEPESGGSHYCAESYTWDSLAFPSIDFRSLERGHWRSPGGSEFHGIWVDCEVSGFARRLFVVMDGRWSGKLQPSGVAGPGVTMVFGSLGGGRSPTTGWHGTLDVTRAHNFEYNGTYKHAFARVEIGDKGHFPY